MKQFFLVTTLVTALCCISLPIYSAKSPFKARTSINAICLFYNSGYFVGICSLPTHRPPYVDKGNTNSSYTYSCNTGVAVIDVVEGDLVRFVTRVTIYGSIQTISCQWFPVTAADIANGYIYLWMPI